MTIETWIKWENADATWYLSYSRDGEQMAHSSIWSNWNTEVCGATIPGVPYFEFKSSPTDVMAA